MSSPKKPTTDKQEAETSDASVRELRASSGPRPAMVAVWQHEEPMCRALLVRAGEPTTLGRGKDVDFALPEDERLSRRHATVKWTGDGFSVEDLGSRNGTYLDGRRITGTAVVTGDATLRVGGTLLLLLRDGRRFGTGTVRVEGKRDRIVGPEGHQVRRSIQAAAHEGRSLLIVGESGTGKEFAARDYHAAGTGGPLVVVNGSAIPESVAESLLFGATRGAYTGANRDVVGYFEQADSGVLFLDEVGLLSASVQQKLLRAVETREIWPLGASKPRRVDVRICAATNEDLQAAIVAGRFRADLYQRLAQRVVTLPPLRARPEEIPFFVRLAVDDVQHHGEVRVHAEFVEACMRRRWPTNVRELTSAVEMACAQARLVGELHPDHLGPEGAARPNVFDGGDPRVSDLTAPSVPPSSTLSEPPPPVSTAVPAASALPTSRELRKEAFREAFLRHRGHVPSAAAEVGIAVSTAYEYARELQGKDLDKGSK